MLTKLTGGGWTVYYDYDRDHGERLREPAKPPGPAWMVELLGVDFFSDAVIVWLPWDVGNDDMKHLQGLPRLHWLDLSITRQVTDSGLEQLKGLTDLQMLDLTGAHVTDAGLEHLRGLAKLQWLHLDDTQVTDAGLEHVERLTDLHTLLLSDTQVTDAGLEHLKRLTSLRYLYLHSTDVTDEGVEKLQQALPNCKIHP